MFEGDACKYILTPVNVASRAKVMRVGKTKKASQVAYVLEVIY